jgi:hypothetical protein
MEKEAFLPPMMAMLAPLMMAPAYGAASAVSGAISGRGRKQLDKMMERFVPSDPPGLVTAKKYGGVGGLGSGALGGTMLGAAIGDAYGSPVPGALIGGLAGATAGHAGGQLFGEHGYNLNKYLNKMHPQLAPYAIGAGTGTALGGVLGHALFDDSPVAGTIGGAVLGGGLGAIANSALLGKGKFGGLLHGLLKAKLHKKSSAWLPGMVSGALGTAGLAGGFGFGNYDLTTKQVLLQRMLPALILGAGGGALLGSFYGEKKQ